MTVANLSMLRTVEAGAQRGGAGPPWRDLDQGLHRSPELKRQRRSPRHSSKRISVYTLSRTMLRPPPCAFMRSEYLVRRRI
jgi:hypothetical protein